MQTNAADVTLTKPESVTLARMCSAALGRDPTLQAVELGDTWVTWGELRQLAEDVCGLIDASGVHPAAPVVLVPNNRPAFVGAFLALLTQARTVRMVYAFQSSTGVARDLDQLEPALVVAAAESFTPEVNAALRRHGAAGIALRGMSATLVEGFERARSQAPSAEAQPEIQILTSGTTGRPKRFGMTHDMVARHVVGANKNYSAGDTDLYAQPPMFSYYPLGNISGIYGVLPTLLRGHRVLLAERFTVELWRDYLKRHKPVRASLPPAGFQMVLDAQVPPEELQCVRFMATGAAPLDL
ncbi:MAG: AMP-binding protein, partial [Polyangiales bacterium]